MKPRPSQVQGHKVVGILHAVHDIGPAYEDSVMFKHGQFAESSQSQVLNICHSAIAHLVAWRPPFSLYESSLSGELGTRPSIVMHWKTTSKAHSMLSKFMYSESGVSLSHQTVTSQSPPSPQSSFDTLFLRDGAASALRSWTGEAALSSQRRCRSQWHRY